MTKNQFKMPFYRFRYPIAYFFAIIIAVVGLVLLSLSFPGGIRTAEQASVLSSHMTSLQNFDPLSIVNAPYHALQKISLMLFGVSIVSIKLPSIILGALALIAFYLIIREWRHERAALVGSVLIVGLPIMTFVSQDGTPYIFSITTILWLLVAATFTTRSTKHRVLWQALLWIFATLLLYVPLGIYFVIILITIALTHPHIRHILKRTAKMQYILSSVVSLAIIAPLIISVTINPTTILYLLGVNNTSVNALNSGIDAFSLLFNFTSSGSNAIMRPVIPLGYLLLVILGLYHFITHYYMARSHVILAYIGTLIPVLILRPDLVLYSLPVLYILIATGVSSIMREWYKLFPFNPYARALGLIPIAAIVIALSLNGLVRYTSSYHYEPSIVQNFSDDITILEKSAVSTNPKIILVSENQFDFYALLKVYNPTFKDTTFTTQADTIPNDAGIVYVTHDAHTALNPDALALQKIITNDKKTDANRFYIYKYDTK